MIYIGNQTDDQFIRHSCRRVTCGFVQFPFSVQLFASGDSHGRVAFLPFVPLRLKYLKPEEVLAAPTTIGEHIRQRRLTLKLTLKEAGKLLGTGELSVIHGEKGERPHGTQSILRVYFLPAIIQFLGYNPYRNPGPSPSGWLVDGSNEVGRGESRRSVSGSM